MKNSHAPHSREMLARGPVCTMEVCGCGSLHLTLGALTVRLDPAAAESVWTTVGEALAVLHDCLEHTEPRRARVGGVS